MATFNQNSLSRLSTCDVRLQKLFMTVILAYDCSILCGHRGEAEQNEAWQNGFSKLKWPNSKHNSMPSLAVDAAPYIGGRPILNDRELLTLFAGYVLGTAERLEIPIRWGGDWNGNWIVADEIFQDLYHYELKGV